MEAMICKACGAPLERDGHCAYCGARYNIESGMRPMLIEVEHPRVRRIVAEARYNRFVAEQIGDGVGELTRQNIVRAMADKLTEAIKYTVNYGGNCGDPFDTQIIVRGELRVVDPDFRF